MSSVSNAFHWELAEKRCLTDKERGKVIVQGPPRTDFPNPEEYPPDPPQGGRCCQDALPNILGRVAQMRCQNIGACCQKCCQKALGQVDEHGRNRRRGLYVKVSFCLHETPFCRYRTDCGHPLWLIYCGNTPVLFWQHTRFVLATRPFYFGNTPVLFWQHNLPPFTWTTPVRRAAGSYSSGSWWLLFHWFHGGSYSAASLVAQRSKIVPRNRILLFLRFFFNFWATSFLGSRG